MSRKVRVSTSSASRLANCRRRPLACCRHHRRTVFDLCAEQGLAATAADVSVAPLREADEVFITSTAGGIMPVTEIDGRPDRRRQGWTGHQPADGNSTGRSTTTRHGRARDLSLIDQFLVLRAASVQKISPASGKARDRPFARKRRSLRFHSEITPQGKDSTS
ncbi:aminotransferase class IV [Mesorhizobium calcicola]|uniref:Aminotransferase class IV n=1 Tax=Mesorhizobium calcicola TaxID=1300310 RepID=A0ABW4WPV2_9HYPH